MAISLEELLMPDAPISTLIRPIIRLPTAIEIVSDWSATVAVLDLATIQVDGVLGVGFA